MWHVHAEEYFLHARDLGEVVGVYDDNAQRRTEFCEKYQVKAIETFEELLSSDAEGVIVATATNAHVEVMVKLANAGKHIFTEKVLALTDEEADAIAQAVEESGVTFVISLFQKYIGSRKTVKAVVDSGELGKVNYLRFRNCHSGSIANWLPPHFYNAEQCGGGAMIDLGAHGMYLTDWILGVPVAATSAFTLACERADVAEINPDRVEDNAVTVMSFANGAIAINETGFVTQCDPEVFEAHGERGHVRMEGNRVVKCTFDTQGKPVEVPLLDNDPQPLEQFLTGNILPGCGMKEARALTHLMVMAYGKA